MLISDLFTHSAIFQPTHERDHVFASSTPFPRIPPAIPLTTHPLCFPFLASAETRLHSEEAPSSNLDECLGQFADKPTYRSWRAFFQWKEGETASERARKNGGGPVHPGWWNQTGGNRLVVEPDWWWNHTACGTIPLVEPDAGGTRLVHISPAPTQQRVTEWRSGRRRVRH